MLPDRLSSQGQPQTPRTAGASQAEPRGGSSVHFQMADVVENILSSTALVAQVVVPETIADATKWRPGMHTMSGSTANRIITDFYTAVDDRMASYLGEPAVANWATFAKYASREAGEQIHMLEGMLNAVEGRSGEALAALAGDFLANPRALGGQARLLWKHADSPSDFMNKAQLLRDTLVHGNTGIIKDIVPAFNRFLDAEFKGRDGLKAMRQEGFGRAPRDPNGHILEAFRHFKAAKALNRALKRLPSQHGPEAEALLAKRAHHVAAANLRLGLQEQWVTLQQPNTFGDPVVAKLVKALTPKMTLTDATGTHALLPNGGDWANFADRMGLIEVDRASLPPEKRDKVYTLADAEGKPHHFMLNPDRQARKGSIFEYFTSNRSPERARALQDGEVRPYDEAYRHARPGLAGLWDGVKRLFRETF